MCGPVNLGHFIVPFELMITLIAQLCFHTGFGKAHSNTLGLNVYVVTQGDEMTQAIHLLTVSLVFIMLPASEHLIMVFKGTTESKKLP